MSDGTTGAGVAPVKDSAVAPLRRRGFLANWSALAGSQMVIWMNTVGAVTVIAGLSGSSTLIALVQTANSLPSLALALVAGAVADIVDRRRLALGCQAGMLAAVSTLGALTLGGVVTPGEVLGLTLVLGAGMATSFVVYQALTPDLVSSEELPAAVTLNSVAINLARAAGPALAGLLIAAMSAGALFLIEAGGLVVLMTVVFRLRPPQSERGEASERFLGALRAGARFVRFSPPVRAVLIRGGSFTVFASALWALLPVVALGPLDLHPRGLGLLLGCVGTGAIAGASLLPRLRRRVAFDLLIVLGTLGLALTLLALAYVRDALLLAPVLLLAGACWVSVLSSLNVAAQLVAPGWVRARTLASFQLVMQGGLASGSLALGILTGAAGVRTALLVAAAGLSLGVAGARRWPLGESGQADLSPALTWSEPASALAPAPSDGPVLVTLEYRISEVDAERFLETMDELGRLRRRDGAYAWNVYEDLADPERYLETFMVDSWQEHLRQHERLTVADVELEQRAKSMHRGPGPPVVRHLLWAPAAARARDRPPGLGADDQ
jgi:MFS family permease